MFGLNEAIFSLITNIRRWSLENTSIAYPAYRRTGDKSNGVFKPISNITLTKNIYNWKDVVIPSGVVVTAQKPGVLIFCESIIVAGLLTSSGLGGGGGAAGGPGVDGEDGAGFFGGGGGSGGSSVIASSYIGGNGGNGRTLGGIAPHENPGAGTNGIQDIEGFNDFLRAIGGITGGGGGGGTGYAGKSGGNGGGYVFIICNKIEIQAGGAIRAEGLNSENCTTGGNSCAGGGGGGGAIIIDALHVVNNGTLSVSGGIGGNGFGASGYKGGNGGAGYLQVIRRLL